MQLHCARTGAFMVFVVCIDCETAVILPPLNVYISPHTTVYLFVIMKVSAAVACSYFCIMLLNQPTTLF